ncbi:hypothetical protein PV963_17400 [Streptomyces coeruleorubidus]|uniref:hypothetical protein n=1 Tax=Streptomyces coeruleorubidus TaxID=116188 RepID=UPI00237FD3F9|nr:hypothetical protein [Streptomyces coeruleorubidus]WDV52024.1 hypothetical protein PV963_17400 [Streptomyces coeruleorubidus]
MHPDIHLALHHARAAELRAEADAHPITEGRQDLRTRVGWTLVEVGLKLATRPRPAAAH